MKAILNADNQTIGVVSVATNIYLNYWKQMVSSANSLTKKSDLVTFTVFTDNPIEAIKFGNTLDNIKVEVFQIPAYRWPDATLLRYSIIEDHYSDLKTDILVYLDADMLIVANPWESVKRSLANEGMCFVQHPGYWRPNKLKRILFYFAEPSRLLADVLIWTSNGGIGAWEKDKRSKAFVPRNKRKRYYCGGIWFGKRKSFLHLIRELSENTKFDSANSIIARWHDESHLNFWSSQNTHAFVSPEFCFDDSYKYLNELSPVVLAVRKKERTR
jgi:hypothetical protein